MKFFLTLLLCAIAGNINFCFAAAPTSGSSAIQANKSPRSSLLLSYQTAMSLTPRQYEKVTGKKLTLKERLAFRFVQWKIAKQFKQEGPEISVKQRHQARLSLIFGAASIVTIFLPYIGIPAIGLAIAGLILGIMSLKGNSNTEGILGVIFSGLVIFIFLLAIVLIAAFFASGGF